MAFVPAHANDLRIGLYIKIVGSWFSHPFSGNTFKIKSQKELNTLHSLRNPMNKLLRADFFNILLCSNLFMGFWREPRVTRPEVQDHCSKPSGLLT